MACPRFLSVLSLLLLLMVGVRYECRKSDFKRVVFSEYVKNELQRLFDDHMEKVEDGTDENSDVIKELYEKYSDETKDYFLDRLQPSTKVGGKQNISIPGNRKQTLTIETISKRRPLIFQIDDFLFEDECDYLISLAKSEGLSNSKTGGDQLEELGLEASPYDSFGSMLFEEVDTDNDSFVNRTELQKMFARNFDNKMGMVVLNDIMKQSCLDFNMDGKIVDWEWNSKNVTKLVQMLNETQLMNPASKVRYSEQTWLDHSNTSDPILSSIQDRIHKLTGLPIPLLKNSEDLQVVRYVPGGHYDCHLDSDPRYYPDDFTPCCHLIRNTDDENDDCTSCRFMTILYYLEDPELGGETAFPIVGVDPKVSDLELVNDNFGSEEEFCDLSQHCQKSNVIVKPKKGRAILWYNHFIHPDTQWTGPVDRHSLHGGCAVHKGRKWIANNWINAGFGKQHDILSWARSEAIRLNNEVTEENNNDNENDNDYNNDNDEDHVK